MNTNNFCRYLSNQIRVEYDRLRPCCWFKEHADVFDTQAAGEFLSKIESIDSWKTSQGNCVECRYRESKNLFSPRLESFNREHLKDATDNSKLSIEIQIDRDCNAACLICGPWNSTTWEKYDNKIKNIPIQHIADNKLTTIQAIEKLSAKINFANVSTILFLGGEPLRTKSHLEFLNLIQHPETVTVKYTTNGSYRPDSQTMETWSKFKSIVLQLSIDGIEDHFEYLRWPLQWHQVEDNIKFFLGQSGSNIDIAPISYTTTPFSLYYHDRYIAWADKTFGNGEYMFSKPWQPRGDTPMSLSAVPPELQRIIREKYGAGHSITNLLEPYNEQQYTRFTEYIATHDQHRNQNWKTVFPEMVPYFT